MRVVGAFRKCGFALRLSHRSFESFEIPPHLRIRFPAAHDFNAFLRYISTRNFNSSAAMGSQHEWSAHRVRKTFIDYFQGNGHTFGIASLPNLAHSGKALRWMGLIE